MTSTTWSPAEGAAGAEPRRPGRGSARQARRAVLAVGVVALVLALVHGAEQPPWAYEDEQQHVDLALKLADGGYAHIEDLVDQSVVDSTLESGRPSRQSDPTNDDASTWGLEGRSYMGYHPPLAPALLAPVAFATGGDAHATMRAGRVLAALLVAAATMLVAVLAAGWCPERRGTAAAMAGLAFGTLPVVSDLGGRWSNDVVVLALSVAACFVATRVAVAPTNRDLVLLSVLMAGAVSAKATGAAAVAAAVLVAGPTVVRRRGWPALGAVVALPAVAALAWVAVTQVRYGTLDGSAAFREVYGTFYEQTSLVSSPFDASGGSRLLLHHALLPQLNSEWGLGDLVPVAVVAGFVAGVVGVARQRRAQPVVMLAGIAVPSLVLLEVVMRHGQVTPTGRFLVPTLAVAAAVAARTWTRWSLLGWLPPALCSSVGLWFLVEHRPPW